MALDARGAAKEGAIPAAQGEDQFYQADGLFLADM